MKIYKNDGVWFYRMADAGKGATSVETPFGASPKDAFVRWLNEQLATPDDRREEVQASWTGPHPFKRAVTTTFAAPAPAGVKCASVTDDMFEALPLAYQLHLAALAMENARDKIKP
jgi:hypothetical protein